MSNKKMIYLLYIHYLLIIMKNIKNIYLNTIVKNATNKLNLNNYSNMSILEISKNNINNKYFDDIYKKYEDSCFENNLNISNIGNFNENQYNTFVYYNKIKFLNEINNEMNSYLILNNKKDLNYNTNINFKNKNEYNERYNKNLEKNYYLYLHYKFVDYLVKKKD